MSFLIYTCILALIFVIVSSNPIEESEINPGQLRDSNKKPRDFHFVCNKVVKHDFSKKIITTRCKTKQSEDQNNSTNMKKPIKQKAIYFSAVEANADRINKFKIHSRLLRKTNKVKSSMNYIKGNIWNNIIDFKNQNVLMNNELISDFENTKQYIKNFYKDYFKKDTANYVGDKVENEFIPFRLKRGGETRNSEESDETSTTKNENSADNKTEKRISDSGEQKNSSSEEGKNDDKNLSDVLPVVRFRILGSADDKKRKLDDEYSQKTDENTKKEDLDNNGLRTEIGPGINSEVMKGSTENVITLVNKLDELVRELKQSVGIKKDFENKGEKNKARDTEFNEGRVGSQKPIEGTDIGYGKDFDQKITSIKKNLAPNSFMFIDGHLTVTGDRLWDFNVENGGSKDKILFRRVNQDVQDNEKKEIERNKETEEKELQKVDPPKNNSSSYRRVSFTYQLP